MPAGDLITGPWQWEWSGLLMGDGTVYDVGQVTGLDLPVMRTSDQPKTRDHGSYQGIDLLGERVLVLDVELAPGNPVTLGAQLAVLAAITGPQSAESPLVWQLPGQGKRQANVRPRRRLLPVVQSYVVGYAKASVEFVASDPRVYDQVLQSLSTGQATQVGGLSFPMTFPTTFGTAGSGGIINATNAGNFGSRPTFSIAGPCINPVIENRTAGKTISFSITMLAGDTLTVGLDVGHPVYLNGTGSRRNAVTSTPDQWWELQPGVNELHFSTGDAGNTGALLTVPFRSAWSSSGI